MFINEFLNIGLNDYFNTNTYSFECHIIKCMCSIYGIDAIKTLYTSNNQNEFIKLIRKYGYSENSYLRFLGYMNEYESFKKLLITKKELKSNIFNKLENEVITMFGFKYLLGKLSDAEIKSFENNLLNDQQINNLKSAYSLDAEFTKNLWKKKVKDFKNSVNLFSVKVNYLDDETYKKFDIDLETVKQMDYRMVERLNKSILDKLEKGETPSIAPKKSKFVLTSGSGFVDILIMISIITTVISAGVVYIILR